MQQTKEYMTYLAVIGFFLSFASYLMFIPEAVDRVPIMIGLIIISSGYILLFIEALYGPAAKSERDKKAAKYMKLGGYVLLTTFFFLMHLMPTVTFHLRFYDVFAAIGYFSAIFTKIGYTPMWLAYGPLVIYYLFAGGIKFFEKGYIEKIQLVARFMLAAYYGMYMVTA